MSEIKMMHPDEFEQLPITAKLSLLPAGTAVMKYETLWAVANQQMTGLTLTGTTLTLALTTFWRTIYKTPEKFKAMGVSKARAI